MTLNQKIDEAGILSTKVDDLESQLNKEKQDCERMASKIKKLVKAHGRYVKAQEDLKRSQGRFERLADSLASDSLKFGTKEQGYSMNAGNDDQYYAYEMSPYDQRQKHGLTAGKRSTALSTSEEEKSGARSLNQSMQSILWLLSPSAIAYGWPKEVLCRGMNPYCSSSITSAVTLSAWILFTVGLWLGGGHSYPPLPFGNLSTCCPSIHTSLHLTEVGRIHWLY